MRDQYGEKNSSALLTEVLVHELRRLRAAGWIYKDLEEKFDIDGETIRDAVVMRSWKHVKTPYDEFILLHGDKIGKHLPRGIKITAELVRQLFTYDPLEGVLRWNVKGRGIQFGEPAGCLTNGQLNVSIGGKGTYVPRIIWLFMTGKWPQHLVDHKDGVRLNNKWKNLREATNSQNSMNIKVPSNNKLGVRGVIQNSNGTFTAYINANKKRTYLGFRIATLEEAIKIRKEAEIKYHGPFRREN
jgi:hypothetical protein